MPIKFNQETRHISFEPKIWSVMVECADGHTKDIEVAKQVASLGGVVGEVCTANTPTGSCGKMLKVAAVNGPIF